MFAFLPVSATSQINAVQMLVSLSRASREVRLYTDSKSVLREAAIRPGQGASAIELIDGESKPEVDLWQIGHNGLAFLGYTMPLFKEPLLLELRE